MDRINVLTAWPIRGESFPQGYWRETKLLLLSFDLKVFTSKKSWSEKLQVQKFLQEFQVPKYLISKKYLRPNKFKVKKKFGSQTILDPKIFGPKKCWVQKILGSKIFGSNKLLGLKKFWVQKNFGLKKIVGLSKTYRLKNVQSKQILCCVKKKRKQARTELGQAQTYDCNW